MPAKKWFYEYEGRKVGPIPSETLLHLARYGVIHRQTRVWEGEASEPVVADTVDGLFEPVKSFAPFPARLPSDQGESLDLKEGIPLPSEPSSHYAIQIADNFVFSPSDLDESTPTPPPRGVALRLDARPYEHQDAYAWAGLIFKRCEGPIAEVMAKSAGGQLPSARARAQLQQDILFLASAMTEGAACYGGLPIRTLNQVWGTLQGLPDTFLINLKVEEGPCDTTSPTGTAPDGKEWSVSLEEPCMSVRYLSEHDRQHGTSLAKEFIAFASEVCDQHKSHWLLPSTISTNRKKRLLEWLKDSCRAGP
jgi:hypothetical protein